MATPVLNTGGGSVSPLAGLELAHAHVVGLKHAADLLSENPGHLAALVFVSQVLHDADAHPIVHATARAIANGLWPGKPYPNPCAQP